jgi:glutathione peroxidase
MSAHDFEFTSIDGKPLKLSEFAGHPILVVNTASQCGLTPQYRDLEALWQKYRPRGLVVLGVPSNDFGAQEPGSEAEIKEFCSSRYKVSFPMTAKNAVIGASAHPLYKWAVAEAGEAAAPRSNFHKYLIGPKGELAGTFGSKVAPGDPALTRAIETALDASGPPRC